MNSKEIKNILGIFIILLLLDIPIIKQLKPLWENNVSEIQKSPLVVNLKYGFITYIFLCLGLYYFVYKRVNRSNWKNELLINGFLFGIVIYGVFDFTNLSIFSRYRLDIALVDTIWGGILMALTATIVYYLLEIKRII